MFITAIPASLSYPGSLRALLRLAFTILRSHLVAVLAVAALIGGASAGLTTLGSSVAGMDTTDGTALTSSLMWSTLLLAALLSVLMIFTGAVFAVLLPPAQLRIKGPRVPTPSSSGILRRRATKAASIAVVTIIAMVAPIMVPSGAYAATSDQTAATSSASAPQTSTTPTVGYATTVQVQFYNDSRVGTDQDTGVTVSAADAPVGTNPTGMVKVYLVNPNPAIQELWLADLRIEDAQWGYFIPTDKFSSGDNTLHFVYVPDNAAFQASETSVAQFYNPATLSVTTVTNNPSSGAVAFGQTNTVDFTVTSAVDAADLKLELYDESTSPWALVATKPFAIVNGTAQVSLDVTGLLAPGYHPLYWKIPASSAHEAAESEVAGITVTATPTTAKLTIPQTYVGDHTSLSVAVTSDNGVIVNAGTVSFFANSVKVGQADVSNGHASWVYTAAQSGDVDWRVEFRNYGGGFTASDDTGTQQVETVLPSYPVFVWSGSLTPEDTYFTATFESIRGLAVPTGTVNLTTVGGDSIGSGTIVDGVVRIHAAVLNGVSNYYAVYSGDNVWSGNTYWLPAFQPNQYQPVVTLTAPATGVVDQPVALQVGVTGAPDSLLKSVDIYRQYAGGSFDFVGSVDLKGGHTGTYSLTEPMPLTYLYVARATFADGSNVPVTTSDASLVAWAIPAPPQLTLTLGSAGPFSAADNIPVTVNAAVLPGGGAGIPSGTVVKIMAVGSASNTEIGSVTMLSSADGLSGSTTITRPVGGTESLIASVNYGTQSWPATSSPVTLTVAPPLATLSIGAGTARVGENVTFTVYLQPSGTQKAQVSGTVATFTFDGTAYPLYLDRVNPYDLGGTLQGTVTAFVSHAGDLTASVSVAGDGVNFGALSAEATVNAPKLGATLSVNLGNGPVASGAPLDFLVTATPAGSSYAPTIGGTFNVTVSPSNATCTVSNGGWCHLPAGSIVVGDNSVTADYSGDENYYGSSTNVTLTGTARQSYLDWHSTPGLADAVAGNPLTFSWNVTNNSTASLPSQGTVEVTVGTARCEADVAANTCTLTVPYGSNGLSTTLPITIKFLSADDAPSITQTASLLPKDCVFITVDRGTATGEPDATCTRNGRQGFVTGSYVVAHTNSIAAPYAFDAWYVNGKKQTRDEDFSFLVTDSALVSYTTRYAPVCYTLTVDPVGNGMKPGDPDYWNRTELRTKGLIYALTPPNCTDPNTATTDEWTQLANGKPRYAAGTDVLLHVSPISGEPAYTIGSVTGAQAQSQGSDRFHVVMTGDKSVSAVFKVRDCVPVDIKPGDGGSIALVSTKRPDDSRYLLPLDGSCTTSKGAPGFVPGTAVTLRATPDQGMYFGAWRTSDFGPVRYTGANPLARWIIGDAPAGQESGAAGARTATFTVPPLATQYDSDTKLSVGANYSEVQCVAVTTEASWPAGTKEAYSPVTYRPTDDRLSIDDLRCGDRSTAAKKVDTGRDYEYWTQTDWFVGSAVIQPLSSNADAELTYYHDNPDPDNHNPLVFKDATWLTWSADNPFTVSKEAQVGSADGPVLDLEFAVDQKLTVNANWFDRGCRKVDFAYPQGGEVTVRPLEHDVCGAGSVINGQKVELIASDAPAGTNIVPVLSVVDDKWNRADLPTMIPAADGRLYSRQYSGVFSPKLTGVIPNSRIRLEYCVPLKLGVYTRNASGNFDKRYAGLSSDYFDSIGMDGWPQMIADDGGCPPMYARPGATVHVGLTALGAYGYKIVSEGGGPTITVAKDGSQDGGDIHLEAICFSVARGDRVSADTAPNCPSDSSKYVRGTVVQLQADVHGGETFNGWSGVDQSQERYAWVIANQDRSVSVDIHKPSTAEKIGNFFSSVAQRFIAVGAMIATGLLLAEMALVKVVAFGMAAISTGLHLLGVSGPAMDGFDRATAVVAAPLDTVKLFAGCLGSVAHGPDLTDSTKLSALVASGAGKKVIGLTAEQLGKYLHKLGFSRAAKATGGLDQVVDLTNAFGSGSYSGDAATSWKNYGSSLNSCMSDGFQSTLDPVIHG